MGCNTHGDCHTYTEGLGDSSGPNIGPRTFGFRPCKGFDDSLYTSRNCYDITLLSTFLGVCPHCTRPLRREFDCSVAATVELTEPTLVDIFRTAGTVLAQNTDLPIQVTSNSLRTGLSIFV